MALIIKFAHPDKNDKYDSWDYTNTDAIAKGIRYIYKGLKGLAEEDRLFGFVGIPEGVSLMQAIEWMMKAKRIHGAEDGVQCRHIIISFGKKPKWKKKKYIKLVEKIVGIWKGRFQICWGFHHENIGTPRENFHLHLLVNSVDMKTGKRLDLNYKRWRQFKKNVKRKWNTNAPILWKGSDAFVAIGYSSPFSWNVRSRSLKMICNRFNVVMSIEIKFGCSRCQSQRLRAASNKSADGFLS